MLLIACGGGDNMPVNDAAEPEAEVEEPVAEEPTSATPILDRVRSRTY